MTHIENAMAHSGIPKINKNAEKYAISHIDASTTYIPTKSTDSLHWNKQHSLLFFALFGQSSDEIVDVASASSIESKPLAAATATSRSTANEQHQRQPHCQQLNTKF